MLEAVSTINNKDRPCENGFTKYVISLGSTVGSWGCAHARRGVRVEIPERSQEYFLPSSSHHLYPSPGGTKMGIKSPQCPAEHPADAKVRDSPVLGRGHFLPPEKKSWSLFKSRWPSTPCDRLINTSSPLSSKGCAWGVQVDFGVSTYFFVIFLVLIHIYTFHITYSQLLCASFDVYLLTSLSLSLSSFPCAFFTKVDNDSTT